MSSSLLGSLWQSVSRGSDPTTTPSDVTVEEKAHHSIHIGDLEDQQATPKAGPQEAMPQVPVFSLTEDTSEQQDRPQLASKATAPKSLMPPPTRNSNLSPSLRVPSNGPLPNRGPPNNSQQRAGSNARGKVLLSPGHSPMDWASLTKSNNLSGVPSLQRVTPSQLKTMNGRKGKPIWSSYQGKVYNITPYMPFHPGGERELMKGAGRDGTKLFMEIHPWVNWEGMLSACLVGILVSDDAEASLDDID